MTPSTVSHALSRLRQTLGDELFIAGDGGMEPTPRALEFAPGIRDGLERITAAISTKPFQSEAATRTFRVAASDYAAVAILPHLVGRLAKLAPQVDLRIFPVGRTDVIRQLDDGHIDLVIGWFGAVPDRMRRVTVLTDHEALIVRRGHPITAEPVTLERLFSFPHIVVELSGSEAEMSPDGFIDDRGVSRRVWIERLLVEKSDNDVGLAGRVAVSVPHYAAVPPMLRLTDMVATLPRRLALHEAAHGDLVMPDMPYEPLAVPVEALWHQRADRDAGTQWLIGELNACIETKGE